jgi:hypothetical protein
LGLGALGWAHGVLAAASVVVAPTVLGEIPVVIAEGAALYATYVLTDLAIESVDTPCSHVTVDLNPFD